MKRILINLVSRGFTVATVATLTFILLHFVPGSPFTSERKLPEEIEQNLFKKYGLTRQGELSKWEWIANDAQAYLTRLARLDLGPSLKHVDRDVSDIIAQALPVSLELGFFALLLGASAALVTAVILARMRTGWLHAFFGLGSSVIVSLPTFILALSLICFFSLILKWLPPALWEGPQSRILPVFSLAIAPYFYLSQLLLSQLQAEANLPYATTARAKGLRESTIIMKHTLRNSLNPVLGVMGSLITGLLTGSFIVETVFSLPGMGRHFVIAVIDRDYFLVTGITIVFTCLLSLFGFLSDLALWKLDPRTR